MKGLTLWRPWSDAIVHGSKRVENRNWRPPDSVLGELIAIHAGKRYDDTVFGGFPQIVGWLDVEPRIHGVWGVASARHRQVLTLDRDPWWIGPVGWLLEEVEALRQPIAHPGALGLWRVPPEKVAAILEDIAA